jgi:hypothetical protein
MFVLTGCEVGGSLERLSEIAGMSSSAVSRRYDAARFKVRENGEMTKLAAGVRREYRRG